MDAKLRELFALVGGLDRNGPEWSEVREAQGIVKDLEQALGLAS
jgi:hypothetical protein